MSKSKRLKRHLDRRLALAAMMKEDEDKDRTTTIQDPSPSAPAIEPGITPERIVNDFGSAYAKAQYEIAISETLRIKEERIRILPK